MGAASYVSDLSLCQPVIGPPSDECDMPYAAIRICMSSSFGRADCYEWEGPDASMRAAS
jgi:hypothetical protein